MQTRFTKFLPQGLFLGVLALFLQAPLLHAQGFLLTEYKVLEGYEGNILDINFSPQRNFMSVTTVYNSIFLYDRNFVKIWEYQGQPRVAGGTTVFAPDESIMVFGKYQDYGDIAVYDLKKKQLVQKMIAHESYVNSLALTADAQYLISAGDDTQMLVWKREDGEFVKHQSLDYSDTEMKRINEIKLSPDGKSLVAVGNGILIYDFKKGQFTRNTYVGDIPSLECIDFHPSGDYFLAAQSRMVFPFKRNKKGYDSLGRMPLKDVSIREADFDPEGKYWSCTQQSGFRTYRFREGQLDLIDNIKVHGGFAMDVKFSPDKRFVASGATDHRLIVWKRADGPQVQNNVPQDKGGQDPEPDDGSEKIEHGGTEDLEFDVTEEGSNYLLMVAIDDYKYWNPLVNANKDAADVKNLLLSKYTFDPDKTIEVYNDGATGKNILNKLTEVRKQLTSRDNLLIYFSGHGYYNADLDEGYWIPVDAHKGEETEYLPNSTLLKYIKAIPAKHIFLVADACFSGSLFSQGSRGYVENVEQYRSRWALTSGRLEFVSDGSEGKNSPFAQYFIKFLKENNKIKVPVSELVNFVKVSVANNSDQTPIGSHLKNVGDEGGEFVFYLKK